MIPNAPLVLVYGVNGSGKTRAIRDHLLVNGHLYGAPIFSRADADLAWAAGDLVTHPEVFADVTSLYAALSPPLALTIDREAHPIHAATVAPADRPDQARPLARVGGALARLLFTVTRATLAAHRGMLHAIDHPERDLDGHNRAALARYLVRLAARPDARLVIETNEQTFMLAAQLAVAKREIPAEAVRLVQVERSSSGTVTAQEITLTPWGALGDGARNPNLADFRLACDLSVAARTHPGSPRYRPETAE